MIIERTKLYGVYLLRRAPFEDERGFFARMICRRELEAAGLVGEIAQVNLSGNALRGTLRGLHSQRGEAAEDKIVTCIQGEVFDVCVDTRKDSPSFGEWYGVNLSPENGLSLYVPKGFAHGYLTMTEDTRVLYFTTQFYKPGAERGFRFDEPRFAIEWPLSPPFIMSEKDKSFSYL